MNIYLEGFKMTRMKNNQVISFKVNLGANKIARGVYQPTRGIKDDISILVSNRERFIRQSSDVRNTLRAIYYCTAHELKYYSAYLKDWLYFLRHALRSRENLS